MAFEMIPSALVFQIRLTIMSISPDQLVGIEGDAAAAPAKLSHPSASVGWPSREKRREIFLFSYFKKYIRKVNACCLASGLLVTADVTYLL